MLYRASHRVSVDPCHVPEAVRQERKARSDAMAVGDAGHHPHQPLAARHACAQLCCIHRVEKRAPLPMRPSRLNLIILTTQST